MKDKWNLVLRKVKIMIFIVILLFIAVGVFMMFGHFSEGYRGGTLVKLSTKGIVFKTVEGQLNLGIFVDNGTNRSISPMWDFSVMNDSQLLDTLNHAILTNKRVKLHYKEMFVGLPWRGETLYIVDQAEIVR